MARRAVLGHDIIAYLVDGLMLVDGLPREQREALCALLRNADLVTLTFGLDPSCSLASRREKPEAHVYAD